MADAQDAMLAQLARALGGRRGEPLPDLDDVEEVPEDVRATIVQRLEAAWAEGLLRIDADGYRDVLQVLLPEDFHVELPTGPASQHPPGSPGRLALYADRADRRETITGPVDADARRTDRLGVKVKSRANGTGLRSQGWDEEERPPLPGGMYRDSRGRWFDLAGA